MVSAETLRASMLSKEMAEQKFVRLLSNTTNPDTGRLYTVDDLYDLYKPKLPKRTIRRMLDGTISQFSPPEVKEAELTEAERAFFVGLALGFNIDKISWGEKQYVVISTQSEDARKRHLLKETIGTKGYVHDFPRAVKVYLNPEKFDFMLYPNKVVDYKFLSANARLAPFLLGLFSSRLSEKRNLITLSDPNLYPKILKAFETQYGFCLGHVMRVGKERSLSLEVKDPQTVLASLLQSKDVQSLPFLRALSYPSPIG